VIQKTIKAPPSSKKWVGWFRPEGRPQRVAGFVAGKIILLDENKIKNPKKHLVISIPKSSGNAVRRNKLKRKIRSFLELARKNDLNKTQEAKQFPVWVRLRGEFRIPEKIGLDFWKQDLKAVLTKLFC
jgi:RNase P protein component